MEAFLWKLSRGKLILFPYGKDAFVYSELPKTEWANALKSTYPRDAKLDEIFSQRIETLSKAADCVVGCIVHTVNLPRVDIWPVLWYPAPNLESLVQVNDGPKGEDRATLSIAHPSNHRKIKGTECLVSAVNRLRSEGLDISLDVIEGVDINKSRERLSKADVIVDQLMMGYAMTALEGLALGKVVISGFDHGALYQPFYAKSYLGECPIIPAGPDNIEDILRDLYANPDKCNKLRAAGRAYLAHRHSDKACVKLFETIYKHISNPNPLQLENFYTPKIQSENLTI